MDETTSGEKSEGAQVDIQSIKVVGGSHQAIIAWFEVTRQHALKGIGGQPNLAVSNFGRTEYFALFIGVSTMPAGAMPEYSPELLIVEYETITPVVDGLPRRQKRRIPFIAAAVVSFPNPTTIKIGPSSYRFILPKK